MKELLEKLLNNDLLDDTTKTELSESINHLVEAAVTEAKEQALTEAKAEFAAQFVADKEALIEALDTKVEELLKSELDELKEDVNRFRDLEVEYAEKLVEARSEMAAILEKDMNELVNTLDTFLEMRLTAEVEELKEDIAEVKKLEFGRRIFEAFQSEFTKRHSEEDATLAALTESQTELEKAKKELTDARKTLNGIKREKEMSRVLESLQGRPKAIMEAILKSVETDKLDEAYNAFIGRVLHEGAAKTDVEVKSEKEGTVLAESDKSTQVAEPVIEEKTVVVTGDTTIVEENVQIDVSKSKLSADRIARIQRMAGIRN